MSTMRFMDAPKAKKSAREGTSVSGKADGLADFPKYLSCECAKKRKGVWGGELPGSSGGKRQSKEK